jgi:hypothetical protein
MNVDEKKFLKSDNNDNINSISLKSLLNCPIFSSFVNSSLFDVPITKGIVLGLIWRGQAIIITVRSSYSC